MKSMNEFTVNELKNVMANALKRGRNDVWIEASKILSDKLSFKESDPLTVDVFKAIVAYENVLTRMNGKTTRAGYIRPMIDKNGIVSALESLVKKGVPSSAHSILVKEGMYEYTFAWIVTKYHNLFSKDAVQKAKNILWEDNIPVSIN